MQAHGGLTVLSKFVVERMAACDASRWSQQRLVQWWLGSFLGGLVLLGKVVLNIIGGGFLLTRQNDQLSLSLMLVPISGGSSNEKGNGEPGWRGVVGERLKSTMTH